MVVLQLLVVLLALVVVGEPVLQLLIVVVVAAAAAAAAEPLVVLLAAAVVAAAAAVVVAVLHPSLAEDHPLLVVAAPLAAVAGEPVPSSLAVVSQSSLAVVSQSSSESVSEVRVPLERKRMHDPPPDAACLSERDPHCLVVASSLVLVASSCPLEPTQPQAGRTAQILCHSWAKA